MCGIIGIWHRDGSLIDRTTLEASTGLLAHRGPDSEGFYYEGSIGLGHRRLSIIDLSDQGRQPMSTPDGRFTITFNGEIYNYQELQKEYLGDLQLQSHSDTEVLLHLVAGQWETILPKLRGMFAFAVWDAQKKRLLLVRDPFGKKPLYYSLNDTLLCFASEPKAILKWTGDTTIDQQALTDYFLYEYVPAPASGWQGIQQVAAGSWLEITTTSSRTGQWWQPVFQPKEKITQSAARSRLDRLMTQAVQRRLIADVPVGLFLSGGLDSTSIGWYMRQQSAGELHSFSVSFEEKTFNEQGYAARAAQALGTVHHDLTFRQEDFVPTLHELVQKIDIPLADASLLPTYAISKYARQYVTVALDGDGSDELFGGYGTFTAAETAEKLPTWFTQLLASLEKTLQLLPTNYDYFSWDFKLKSFVRGLRYPLPYRNQIWLGSFSDRELKELLQPSWQEHLSHLWQPIDRLQSQLKNLSTFDQVSLLTLSHYLHNDILVKLDRATMYASLEARTPFLDVDLAEFVMTLPPQLKRNKQLLRTVMRGRIPDEIIDRKKQGFALPLGEWLRGPLYDWARGVLAPNTLKDDGILQPKVVTKLLHDHHAGRADHRKKLWTLLTFQLWYDQWVKK